MTRPVKAIIILIVLLSLPILLSAGRRARGEVEYDIPSITLTLLSDRPVTIGDPVDLALSVFHKRGDTVQFPDQEQDLLPLMLRDFSVKKRKIGDGTVKTMVIYTISVFQTGEVSLEPLTVSVGSAELSTKPLTITVLSVLPADEENPELKDIVPPYRARIRTITVVLILLGISSAFAAFIVFKRFLIRPKQAPKTIVESETFFDPYGYSLGQLETIRKKHEQKKADSKIVYTTISQSLKIFFGSLLSIHALEMTTSEMKRYLKRTSTIHAQSNHLINILHRSDMVKFAREIPARKRVEQDIDQSISIIKEAHQKVSALPLAEGGEHSNGV